MTNKIKLNFYSLALILTALIFAYGEAVSQTGTEEAAGSKNYAGINSLMQSQNYEQALAECSKPLSAEADKAALKAVYDNYALLLDKNLKIDLNHITSFYLGYDKTEAASNLQPYFLLISYLDAKQKHKEAAKLLDKVNEIFPQNSFYVNSAPVIFSKAGRIAEAYKIIKEELDKKPDAETEKLIKTQLIEVHINAKKTDDALKILEEEMKKYPQEELYKNYLTLIAQRTGAYDKTMPLIQQNIKSGSSDEASLKSLFYQSMKKGNFDMALAEFERIAAEKPGDISINTMVAELNVISGNHKTAEVLIEKLLKDLPQNTRAHLLKGRLLFDTQKYEEAYRYFGEYIANFKDAVEPKTYYYLALSCIKTGRPVEAVDNMKIEIEKSSVNTSKLLLREMESVFFKEKMFNTAINFFTELSKKYPGDSELFSKISLFHYYKGDYKKAVEYGQKAMEFKSDSFSAAYILAMAHSKLGDNKKAMELFKLCAQTSPGLSTEAFNASVEQSASLVWPFAHQYLCYIHSALRCGEMSKVTTGLNELFGFLAEKTPPSFVVKDIQSVNPFAVRPEYSLFASFEFFMKNAMNEEYYKNIAQKGEAAALVNFFVKDTKIKELYQKSLEAQFKGEIQASLDFTLEALKIEPENIFLLIRAASAGIAVNSYYMMPLGSKILAYNIPASASEEEKAMKCCVSAFKIGARNAFKKNISDIGAIKKSLNELSDKEYATAAPEGIAEFEEEVKALKGTKFKNIALMMESTLYYFKGDVNKSKAPVFEYIKQEPDISTFIWFITNLGGYFIL